MSTSPDVSSLTRGLLDDELDRSGAVDRARGGRFRPDGRPGIGVGLVQGSFASLTRDPLAPPPPAGLGRAFFSPPYSRCLFLWSLFGTQTDHWLVTLMMFLRFAIAAACAGVIVSRINLTASQVRWIEYVLFGSFTIILIVTQYIVNLDLLRQDDIPGFISHMKNGVMGMFGLMVIYGMFIPNDPRSTARVVLTMALATLAGMAAAAGTRRHRCGRRAASHVRARRVQRDISHDRRGPGDLRHLRLERPAIGAARGQEVRPVSDPREDRGPAGWGKFTWPSTSCSSGRAHSS